MGNIGLWGIVLVVGFILLIVLLVLAIKRAYKKK
jgi:uncharacterized integral membrane protein